MWLTIESGPAAGRVVELTGDAFALGEEGAEIRTREDGQVELHPEADAEVFVGGERVREAVALNGNETIRLHETLLVLSLDDPRPAAAGEESVEQLAEVPPAARNREGAAGSSMPGRASW